MNNLFHYLKGSSQNSWGITVSTCGYQTIKPFEKYPLEGHPKNYDFKWEEGRTLKTTHLVYILTGTGSFVTNTFEKKIIPGDLILIYPGQWHSYKPDSSTGWEEYWIEIHGNMFEDYLMNELFDTPETFVKNIGYHEEFISLIQNILKLAEKRTLGFEKIITGIVWQLVAYVVAPSADTKLYTSMDYVKEETLKIIRQQLTQKIDFKLIAEKMNMSYSHYRKLICENFGKPPHQILIEERLILAVRLLVSTRLSVSEISERTGYKSIYHFSRSFKKHYGISPLKKRALTQI